MCVTPSLPNFCQKFISFKFLTGEACSTCTAVCGGLSLQKKCTVAACVNWSGSHNQSTVQVYRQDKQCVQQSQDQNSYFGMSVDVAVVGTGQSGIEKE